MTCSSSALAGMSPQDKQAALTAAQAALVNVMLGKQGVSFSYTQGDGAKAVTMQVTSAAALRAFIAELQAALGLPTVRRRPLRPVYF